MKKAILSCLAICLSASAIAEDVVIKDPGYFSAPVRDGLVMFPDSLVYSSDAEEIVIPDIGNIGCLGNYIFPKLKKITFGDVDYLPGGLLFGLPELEEVVFDGMIGHFDCTLISMCPKLRKLTFRGPISSTGGPGFLHDLPNLEEVVFESAVIRFGVDFGPWSKCPKLNGFTDKGAFLEVYNDSLTNVATVERIRNNPHLISDLERLADWQTEILRAKDSGWMRGCEYRSAKILLPVLEQLSSPKAAALKAAMQYAWDLGDDVKTKLEILKETPAYGNEIPTDVTFCYAEPSDSLLTLSRQRFNLDSIAGDGDDISRIKNLLYWVHNNIRHDGSNGLAPGERNLRNTYDSARRDSCGYNCRALAICLAEALLAEGIPARYVTCLPKAWDTDNDCHVICVAWSESLGKWIWVDPTFAAYVTDEKGLLLHPGEVRYRLQHDLPLVLNEDANWNNRWLQTKEDYIDDYMAKNLYILQVNSLNQAEPEDKSNHRQGQHVTLVPVGVEYPNTNYTTNDEAWFWQAPSLK